MVFHHASQQQVLQELHSDLAKGLTSDQVSEKRSRFGENKLKEKKRKSNLQRFINQFKDVMILILIIAAAISLDRKSVV